MNAHWLPQIGLTSMLCEVVDKRDVVSKNFALVSVSSLI